MSESSPIPDLPQGAAVAATDGSVSKAGASAGVVLVHAGILHLEGLPLPGVEDSWVAEAAGAGRAIASALGLGATRLRLLIDHFGVASFVQGWRPDAMEPREQALADILERAAREGLDVTARVVQGHAETADLPSRMNDVAHLIGDIAMDGDFRSSMAFAPDWSERLVESDRRFRPTRTHQRWAAFLPRRRTAHFLGVDPGTVDDLVRHGYLDVAPEGVTRRSAAAVYEVAQRIRQDAFFGFSDPERVPGRLVDEISRGWDGRPSGFTGRKSGIRPEPPVPAPEAPDAAGASFGPALAF
jgi:hypothetical protein